MLIDLRLVLTRDGQTRASVDGRPLLVADSPADVLRFLSDRLTRHDTSRAQLEALRTAIVPSPDYRPIPQLSDAELNERINALEGTSSAVGQLYIATLRAELDRRAESGPEAA